MAATALAGKLVASAPAEFGPACEARRELARTVGRSTLCWPSLADLL